ncbi:MAG: 30S ribosomal protein S14 [Kistimonas sp.]|nr:30S ribosomal protein S14 [Kistimonas sp.]
MAKESMKQRERKRQQVVARFSQRRAALMAVISNVESSDEERWQARMALQAQPRNASKVRLRNRCRITGRPRAYMRRFGLSRIKLREAAMRGDVPGLVKASW